MPEEFRGGNSRALAKALDALRSPVAVLDRNGQVVYVNARLCQLVGVEHTQIVGQQCRWDLTEDSNPLADLLYTLAPPQTVRNGKVETRVVYQTAFVESSLDRQTFVPILDEYNLLDLAIVTFHTSTKENSASAPRELLTERQAEQLLVQLRSSRQRLDNMRSVIGESPAIGLAMERAQAAVGSTSNVFIHGPTGVGKLNLGRGIFDARIAEANANPLASQFFVLDCGLLDADLIDGLLEVMAGRIKPDLPIQSHHLVLNGIQELGEASVMRLSDWLAAFSNQCIAITTSTLTPSELELRGSAWESLVCRLMQIEIRLPALSERPEDIPSLVHEIVSSECRKAERALLNVSADAMELISAYPWPRNRSQLEEALVFAVENSVLTASIQPSHLPVHLRTFAGDIASQEEDFEPIELDKVMEQVERKIITKAMQHSPRNRAEVARILGISRTRLLRRIDQLGLQDE